MKKLLTFIILLILPLLAFPRSGKITGKIIDLETGEEMIGATVIIHGTSFGAVTDLNGNYVLTIDPGTYALAVSYVSYTQQVVENVEVKGDEITEINISLTSELELEEIIIQAEAIKDNDVALLKIQKKALAIQDGISNWEMKRLGVSNAAESMEQVTGATIEEGKYMVMRGLGDRYSITQLNGVTIPSADPYRNSSSMDLIPADMIENITTVKTFTADQPGNYTGGKVNITTISIPSTFYFNFKVSTSYNTQSSLIDDFKLDQAANNQVIGFDDGTRAIPTIFQDNKEHLKNGQAETTMFLGRVSENEFERNLIDQSARSLNNSFLPGNTSTFLNNRIELAMGNTYYVSGKPLGLNLGLNWGRGFEHRGNKKTGLVSGVESGVILEQDINAIQSIEEAELSGLLSLSYQPSNNSAITLISLISHVSENNSAEAGGYWRNSAADSYQNKYVLYRERYLWNNQLMGKHVISSLKNAKVDWALGYMTLGQDEPDYRQFSYVINTINGKDQYIMNKSEIGRLPTHFYRYLEDNQINGQIDFTLPMSYESENLFKFGYSYSNKHRVFNEFQYAHWREPIQPQPGVNDNYVSFSVANGDLETYFDHNSNYGVVGGLATNTANGRTQYGFGNYYADLTVVGNLYTGSEVINSGYVMGVFRFSHKLKTIIGLRAEQTNMKTQSADTTMAYFGNVDENGDPLLESRNGKIDQLDLLPSLNMIYNLSKKSNIRFGLNKTLARPNMREISPFASLGSIHEPTVLGNKDLKNTQILNVDLRYEIYPNPGELIAVSAYYKDFGKPIVWLLTPKASTPEIQPINVENALVYGFEFEFRKRLDVITEALREFEFATNLSLIYSRVNKGKEEMEAIGNSDRTDIEDWRPLQGQSPYIVNVRLTYANQKMNWNHTLSFNVWGERLSYVTGALDPDVFEQPRPSLNYIMSKGIGNQWRLGFKWMNILNMEFRQIFDYVDETGKEYLYEFYTVGTEFNMSFSYHF